MKAGNGRRTEGASDETTSIRHMHARSTEREITRWDQPSDLLVVGGGPAGIAAALAAHRSGLRVTLVDDNPTLGGQIWRREENQPTPPGAIARLTAIGRSEVRVLSGARVIASMEPGQLIAESDEDVYELRYKKLVLATGARERFLPFPGWTLPQVLGAGGLQALVKSGWPIAGKRVIVAGSGPLLLEVAAFLRKKGADILLIAEQAPWERLLRFGLKLVAYPAKAAHAFVLTLGRLAGVLYLTRCWPVAAHSEGATLYVTLCQGSRRWDLPCDYLACGFHLVPNVELAQHLGCVVENGCVRVNEFQETTVPGVFAAGEPTGIGGVERALVEGEIAGYAASGRFDVARRLFGRRQRWHRFARLLEETFTLSDELKALPTDETILCRCEDVLFGRVRRFRSWREAKLHTRCGMGPCQGRVCGTAVEFLLGWERDSVRPPLFPARIESLMQGSLTAREGLAT